VNLPLQPTTTPVAAGVAPTIAAGDAAHVIGSDAAVLTFSTVVTLTPSDAQHDSSAGGAGVSVGYSLQAAENSHLLRSTSAAISVRYALAPVDGLHPHRAELVSALLSPPSRGVVTRVGGAARETRPQRDRDTRATR
jgi:hypothetical protein